MRPSTKRLLTGALTTAAAWSTLLAPASAAPPFPITESFTRSTTEAGWTRGGAATLTAPADGEGNGWLRLTPAQQGQFGYVFNDVAFPSTNGVLAEFDYATWGGTGADGLVFFLYDGATPGDEFKPGPEGGSLGYSHCPSAGRSGLHNAYVGVGLDEWGNFSLGSFCNQGGEPGSALLKNRVTVRAGEGGATPYRILATQVTSQSLIAQRWQARHVTVAINDGKLQTYIKYPDGQIQTVAKDVALPAGAPPTLKLGFVASTGGSTNNHEIRNTKVVEPVDLVTTVGDAETGGARGRTHTWTATVLNRGPNTTTGATVRATSPSGLTEVRWTCTADSGACAAPSGTGFPDTSVTLPSGATATYTITADSSASTDFVRLDVDAQPTGDTGELAPLDNAGTDTTVLPPVNDVAPTVSWNGTVAARTANGTWRGGGLTYTYRWQTCAADGTGCTDTAQTGPTWTPDASVTGRTLRLAVTATNAAGTATAHSAPVELPETDITDGPAPVVGPGARTLTFTGTGTSTECRIDDGAWTPCSSPLAAPVAAGPHSVAVRAHRGVLADATPAVRRWTVDDRTSVALGAPRGGLTRQTRPVITFAGDEPGDYVVAIDGTPVAHGSLDAAHRGSVVPAAALADGPHRITVTLIDAVGNRATDEVTVTVDATPPAAPELRDPPAGNPSARERTLLWVAEPGTSARCRLDGGEWTPCSSGVTWAGLAAGDHVAEVELVDAAGNVSQVLRTSWRVEADSSAPASAPAATPAPATTPAPALCASRRSFRIHWTLPRGAKAKRFRIRVDGRPVATLPARARAWTVDLRGRGPATVRVSVQAEGTRGARGTVRVYRTCRGKAASTLPTIQLRRGR